MRHWKPYIREAVAQLSDDGFQRVVAICMAPHASRMSTGAYRKKLEEARGRARSPAGRRFRRKLARPAPVHPGPGRKGARRPRRASRLRRCPGLRYVFQRPQPAGLHPRSRATRTPASSCTPPPGGGQPGPGPGPMAVLLPERRRDGWALAGPPYRPRSSRSWQPTGVKDVLVTPVGFVAEHVEILYDLDIEARQRPRTAASTSTAAHPSTLTALHRSPGTARAPAALA